MVFAYKSISFSQKKRKEMGLYIMTNKYIIIYITYLGDSLKK